MKIFFSNIIIFCFLIMISEPAQALMMVEAGFATDDRRHPNIEANLTGTAAEQRPSIMTDIEGWFTTRTVSTIYLTILNESLEFPGTVTGILPEAFATTLDSISAQEFAPSVNAQPDWFGVYDIQWVLNNWTPRPGHLAGPKS